MDISDTQPALHRCEFTCHQAWLPWLCSRHSATIRSIPLSPCIHITLCPTPFLLTNLPPPSVPTGSNKALSFSTLLVPWPCPWSSSHCHMLVTFQAAFPTHGCSYGGCTNNYRWIVSMLNYIVYVTLLEQASPPQSCKVFILLFPPHISSIQCLVHRQYFLTYFYRANVIRYHLCMCVRVSHPSPPHGTFPSTRYTRYQRNTLPVPLYNTSTHHSTVISNPCLTCHFISVSPCFSCMLLVTITPFSIKAYILHNLSPSLGLWYVYTSII